DPRLTRVVAIDLLAEGRYLHCVTVLDRPHGSEGLPDRVDAVGPCGEQTLDVVRPSVRGEVEVHVLAPIEEGVTDGTAHEIDLVAGRGESLPQLNGRERRIHQPAHALRDHAPRIRCLAPSTEAEDGSRKTEVGSRKFQRRSTRTPTVHPDLPTRTTCRSQSARIRTASCGSLHDETSDHQCGTFISAPATGVGTPI